MLKYFRRKLTAFARNIYPGNSSDPSKDKYIFLSGKRVSIGSHTYGYENIHILSWGEESAVKIGKFCSISGGLTIYCGGNHRTDWITTFPFGHVLDSSLLVPPVKGHPASRGNVYIGNDVWIGRDVTILSGVKIGDGAVIGANSHVVSNVRAYSIVCGNPAERLCYRFEKEVIEKLLQLKWWNYPPENIKRIVPFLCNQNNEGIINNLKHIENLLKE